MKFSLPTAVVLFCATTVFALPQADSFDANNLAIRDDEVISLDVGDLFTRDAEEIEVEDIDLDEDDFESLAARATKHCSNDGLIKRIKKEYKGKCAPKNSKGKLSAHNCKNKGGKSYLCVQGKKAQCYTIGSAQSNNFESGECFV
jgi:hypothetical protein